MDWLDHELVELWVGSLLALIPWLYYLAKRKKKIGRSRKMIMLETAESTRNFEDWLNLILGLTLIAIHILMAFLPYLPVWARVLSGAFALLLSYVWRTSTRGAG